MSPIVAQRLVSELVVAGRTRVGTSLEPSGKSACAASPAPAVSSTSGDPTLVSTRVPRPTPCERRKKPRRGTHDCLRGSLILVAVVCFAQPPLGPADRPAPRTDPNSVAAHSQLLDKARAGRIDIYFEGDSITRRWGATDYPELLDNWKQNFYGWNAANFGWGGDLVQNILWRLKHGELDGVHPKIIVLLAGTNNVGARHADAEDVTRGIRAILRVMRQKAPDATIVLTAIFPRNDNTDVMPVINLVNERLARLADGKHIRFVNVNDKLAAVDGRLLDGMMNPDKLHPAARGYQVWADALKPIFSEVLGPPSAMNQAPPATGDPSKNRPERTN